MKILGIGNAIVDVICKVDDSFIDQNNLTKSTMKLFFDEKEFKSLLANLRIEKTVSGGSVANSIVGISQLGNQVGFIGKVSDDEFGSKYEEGLKKENVDYFYSKKKEELPTGTCLILVTPDAERTMCTFLGTAGKINDKDINSNAVKQSEITFLEGYLWDEGDPKKAFDKAITHSKRVAMSLSDLFCVERHKDEFISLIKNYVNILFGNDQEIEALLNGQAKEKISSIVEIAVVTNGPKGANIFKANDSIFIPPIDGLDVLDTTGAGDLFAAGFLFGFSKKLTLDDCGKLATKSASHIIQQYGARPVESLSKLLIT